MFHDYDVGFLLLFNILFIDFFGVILILKNAKKSK